MKIKKQLDNHKVFSNERAPFFVGVQTLSVKEREQLGDCFGDLPRSVYEKARKHSQLGQKLISLEGKMNALYKQHPDLKELKRVFSLFDFNLHKNGFSIPQSLDTSLSGRGLAKEKDQVVVREFLDSWQKFQANSNDLSLTSKQLALCKAVQEAQKLSSDEGATINSLNQQIENLGKELPPQCPYLTDINSDFPSEETTLRRTLMAGKPGATIADCWNVITSKERQFQGLGNYEDWGNKLQRYETQFDELNLRTQNLFRENPQDLSVFLNTAADLVNQFNEFSDYTSLALVFDSFQENVLRPLGGGIPEDYNPSNSLSNKVSLTTQSLLGAINQRLYQDQGQEPPKGMSPQRSIEQYLNAHSDMDATQRQKIQQVLKIAAKLKVES